MVAYLAARKVAWRIGVCLLGMLLLPGVQAESLRDPTRPAAEFGVGAAGGAETAATGPVLQSVLISSGRKSAIIGGQLVHVGDKYGEARVARITESEVVLKTGSTTETLKLFPDVEKLVVRGARQKQDGTKHH